MQAATERGDAQLAVDCRCRLGEGIVWDERRQVLLWTDIHAARLWQYEPQTGETRSWRLADRLGSFALCESGCLLLGLAKGLYVTERHDGAEQLDGADQLDAHLLACVDEYASLRVNDGRTDRSGNFVFGTLNEAADQRAIGRFYQYSALHGLRALDLGGVAIPNSLAFSPDGCTLYFCDTRRREIMMCSYDATSARTGAPRLFARVTAPGWPDGATVDREGRLWSAQWGAGRVVCYRPDGAVEEEVAVQTPNPTCPAFGAAKLDTLYITSAREELSAAQLKAQPHAGGVYRAALSGVTGLPEQRFVGL
jgi:L-arabinonolactonase